MVSSLMSQSEREGTPWHDGMGGCRLDDDCTMPGLHPCCWLQAHAFRIWGTWYTPTARIPTVVKPLMRSGMLMGELDDDMVIVRAHLSATLHVSHSSYVSPCHSIVLSHSC